MSLKSLAAAVAATLLALPASAATLSFAGTGASHKIGRAFDNQTAAYKALVPRGAVRKGDVISVIDGRAKSAAHGLSVSGPARVTYTFLGAEAAIRNFTASDGAVLFRNRSAVGASLTVAQRLAGLVDFAFGTDHPLSHAGLISNAGVAAPRSSRYAIGYGSIFNEGRSAIVFFDDIAASDRDFDDMTVRIDVAAVPVPAAGLMLVAGLGGLAALRRRRAAA